VIVDVAPPTVVVTVLGPAHSLVTVCTSVIVVLQSERCPLLSVHCAGTVTVEAGAVGHTVVPPHGTGLPLSSKQPVHCAGVEIVIVDAGAVGHTAVPPHGTGLPLSSKQPVHCAGTVTVAPGAVGHAEVPPHGIGLPLSSKQPTHVEGTGVFGH